MAEVTIKLDSPIITTDKSISEITTDGLANTGEIALATDGIVGNVNGALRKYPNPIKTFYVEKFVATGAAKWGFEPKDVKTNDVVIIKTATESLMFTVAEATNTKATLCAFTKNGGTRIVKGQKVGSMFISFSHERVADYYSGKTYEYSLSEDLSLTGVTPFTKIDDAEQCVPSKYTKYTTDKNYLRLKYNSEELLPIGASYNNSSGHSCVFYFIINHKGQQKLVVFQVSAFLSDDPITMSLSFVDLGFSPFNLTIGKTTKQINGTADVSFSAEEITDKFNGALIQNLTTASTEADIRKAFTDNGTVKFPTPGSIIAKLDGGNRGIVVSLSEPDVTTLGRTITVYHGNDTYTIIVKSDFTKVLMPWSKVSPKRNVYTEDVKRLEPEYDEARIKDYLTPQVYRAYDLVYPVKPQTGDLVMEYYNDELRYVAIKVVRNQENPDEYTDILIPESGTANAYTRIVLKNDLTAVKSRNPYYILKTCKRLYDGDLLLALDTVKAETIENSITKAYSFSIEGRNTRLAAQLPEVGDLIATGGYFVPVCETFVEPRTFVQHTRWFSKGKLYEVTVNTALTRVPEDPKVVYDTTSGTLRDLYISAGAKYNEATGFYELNGLTDITEEEMRKIYMLYITNSPKAEDIVSWLSYPNDFRTNIAPRVFYVSNIQNSISGNSVLEVLALSASSLYIHNSAATAHGSFPKLRRVVGDWVYVKNTPSNYNFDYGQPFQNCPLLEEIRMKGINKSHTFAVSPNLSKESVLYMITNANPPSGAAAGSISITLHPDAYTRLKDDADIIAALEAKNGVVTLVSA
jgi:hypothetical protein